VEPIDAGKISTILLPAFPAILFKKSPMLAHDHRDAPRIETELMVSGLTGPSWPEITVDIGGRSPEAPARLKMIPRSKPNHHVAKIPTATD